MATAIVGLLGVVLGLAVGRGYTFWSTRRSELAEALFASAALEEEVRRLRSGIGSNDAEWAALRMEVDEVWHDRSRWLLLHMGPRRF